MKQQKVSKITTPVEIRFNPWNVYSRLFFGVFWIVIGAALGYVLLLLPPEPGGSEFFKNIAVRVILVAAFPVLGYFSGIRWALKRLWMPVPRMILYADRLEYNEINGSCKTIFWKDVRSVGYRWLDDGTIASTFNLIFDMTHGQQLALDVKAIRPSKEWVYETISSHLNVNR